MQETMEPNTQDLISYGTQNQQSQEKKIVCLKAMVLKTETHGRELSQQEITKLHAL